MSSRESRIAFDAIGDDERAIGTKGLWANAMMNQVLARDGIGERHGRRRWCVHEGTSRHAPRLTRG